MRLIVCGCRDWADVATIRREMDYYVSNMGGMWEKLILVNGGAAGADSIAAAYARERGATVETHEARWDDYGPAAGPIRNKHMAKLRADLCLAFWDGESRGTHNMILLAYKYGIPVTIVPKVQR